ncbi:SacI homology domain-domain-containing protein [Coniella lustricola]|uniref:phosphoinositide 5-phosphatase n=1 Tax=Coniella lustricola TaxID=2025994 RepID=A0A2T3ACZ5_9PEZI|nr:SacI homology domain-domain-containing protein [Coniella lustricola]
MDPNAPSLWSGQAPSPEKSSRLLIRDYPHRAIAIVSNDHALIFRHSPTTSEAIANGSLTSVPSARPRTGAGGSISGTHAPKCMVEFIPVSNKILSEYRPLTPRPIYGTLGLVSVGRDVFLSVITHASRVSTLRPGETIERILAVEFHGLNTSEYDDVFSAIDPYELEMSDNAAVYGQTLNRREGVEHPCSDVQKLLSNGSFYYSTDFDLTNRLQDRPADANTFDIDNFDEGFLWNSYMINPLVQFRSRLMPHERELLDTSRILTSAIRGFCLTMTIPQTVAPLRPAKTGMPSYLTIISRLSCRRAGTRFNSRGIDDDGNVANFVETESIYWSPSGVLFSYAQVRGSVPVFWEQAAGLLPGQQKISITRSPEGTQPAFNKHFSDLEHKYGAVHVVNLLSESKPGEVELSQLYRYGIGHCPLSQSGGKHSIEHALLRATEYDFHAETKGPTGYEAAREIRRYIEGSAEGFAYYLAEETDSSDEYASETPHVNRRYVVVLQQEGVFRTNCLDCLDRTNLIQTIVSQMAVEAFLGHRGECAQPDFWMRHSSLWADNGDSLSRIYAGTGALKSSFTRHGKMSLAGAFADARKSATRLYINNFTDKQRQTTIDMLLGRLVGQSPVSLYDPINDYVNAELTRRGTEFSSTENIRILVGTFNLNGRTDGINEDLSAWLCPEVTGTSQPEIIVVGFQEIVELSPQQIMNSDPTRKQLWEQAVRQCLSARAKQIGGEKYVLLRSGQLVGAALCIFVRASVLPNIKNVEGSVKKTGLSGMAGNKGAVAIRLDYANTQICFVTAHLAAGFSNYDERNKDYATISQGLRFQRNRAIDDHDTVIWLGDFNYRIGLSWDRATDLVQRRDLERLYENDQLNLQMVAGLSFPFYSEARINFMPTYKFDIGTDDYDSSEKQRIPAWTDRILRKGSNLRQLAYNSAPLKFSDHRPVYALFECQVSIVNEGHRDKISRDVYLKRKTEVGDATANVGTEDTEDEDLIGYDAIEPGLPPASSDRQKWWLDNGKQAQSTLTPPKPLDSSTSTILNPNRQSNPFTPSEEPDWVTVPRADSRLSSFSNMSTSPYEHINHSTLLPSLSSSVSSTPPRKLPPPYDPSTLPAKVGRLALNEEQYQSSQQSKKAEAPPAPPPRRTTGQNLYFPPPPNQTPVPPVGNFTDVAAAAPAPTPLLPRSASTASTASHRTSKRPPPAVAKKPAHLITSSPTESQSGPSLSPTEAKARPIPPRRPSTNVQNVTKPVIQSGLQRTISAREPPTQRYQDNPQAPLPPPRRVGTATTGTTSSWSNTTGWAPPGAVGLVGLGMAKDERAAMPARKPVTVGPLHAQDGGLSRKSVPPPTAKKPVIKPKSPVVDLLGDDGSGAMGGWEALKPS